MIREVGYVLVSEAKSKAVDVLLGPTGEWVILERPSALLTGESSLRTEEPTWRPKFRSV
jgi:hypothetical protein